MEEPTVVLTVEGGDRDVVGYARDGDDARRRADAHSRRQAAGARASVPREPRGGDRRRGARRRISPASICRSRIARRSCSCRSTRASASSSRRRSSERRFTRRSAARAASWSTSRRRTRGTCSRKLRLTGDETDERAGDPIYELQRQLGLQKVPRALVCFDISHAQGTDTVASCVWFQNGRPYRAEYRKFKVKTVEGIDDFASMNEVVDALLHAAARGREAAARPRVDRRRQGPAQRRARGARRARPRRDADHQPGEARGGDLRARAGASRCDSRAVRPRCACCSRRATRRIASRSPSSASAARCVRSRRSCCAFPASARRSVASCWRPSVACRAFATRRPEAIAALPGFGQKTAERIVDALRDSSPTAARAPTVVRSEVPTVGTRRT